MILDQQIEINNKLFKINYKIGQGGAGVVYEVKDKQGKQYALKMIRNYTKDKHLKQMVDQQVKIQKMFQNEKYIINYYGQKIQGNNFYILFELGSCSLRNKIEMSHFPQNQYIQMLIDVSHGLMSIHQKKMIHRDIKPENVIYSKGVFKITDFGTSTEKQISNAITGTCIYWAPQIIEDLQSTAQNTQFTQALDIWSFGLLAFEAYFLIHPFFYEKDSNLTQQQAMRQVKQNIDAITPNFTFGKLISHLLQLGHKDKARFIQHKLKQTDEALQQSFKGFFCRAPQKRQSIQILLAIFQSIQSYQFQKVEIKSSKLLQKADLPAQVDFFLSSLNLFYKLNHIYKYPKDQVLEYYLELGSSFVILALRFLTIKKYNGKDFVTYHCNKKITQHDKTSPEHYDKIKETLAEYYFYLAQTKQLQFECFADQLPKLKLFICLCSCWHLISDNVKKFLRKVEQITRLENGGSVRQFRQIIPALTENQLSSLENWILCQYFR